MTSVTHYMPDTAMASRGIEAVAPNASDTSRYQPASQAYKLGLSLMYIPFGFDFKDHGFIDNPEIIRTFIVTLAFMGFFLAISMRDGIHPSAYKSSSARLYFNLWCFFSVYIITITALRSDISFDVIRYAAPFVFMVMSMFILLRHIEANYDPNIYWNNIIIAGVISMIWTFYFGRFTSTHFDEDEFAFIDDIRYTILSSTLLPLCGIGLYKLARGINVFRYSVLFSFIFFLFVISKTRGVLLGVISALIYVILISDKRGKAFLRLLGFILLAVFAAIIIPASTRNLDILQIWEGRLYSDDGNLNYLTYYTRLAEYLGQLRLLLSDAQSAVFGYGYMTNTYWDPYIFDMLFEPGANINYFSFYGTGVHSAWINALFQAGFIAGWIPTFTFLYVIWIGMRIIALPSTQRKNYDEWGLITICITMALFLPVTFASFFTDRIGPIIIGPTLLYAIFTWEKFKKNQQENVF